MTGMVNGLKKKPGNRPRRVVSVRFSCEQNSPRSAESLRVAHYLAVMLCPMDRRMGSLACQPAVPHIPSGAFLSLGERTLVACTNGLSVKMDPNDVTGRAKKLEEKEEEEGEELFRSALESARAVAWRGQGHYLASSPRRERKEENNFRPFNAPDFPLLSSSSASSSSPLLAVRRHGRCQAAKSALCLPRTDRLLRLLACLGR